MTAFLRSAVFDTAFEALGNTTVVHSTFDEYDAVDNDDATPSIIIDCAASGLIEAILRGIRVTKIQKKPILVHLSGTGNVVDGSKTGTSV